MAVKFLANPVDITIWQGTFTDVDLSAYLPANATGAIIHCVNDNASSASLSTRSKGSTDTLGATGAGGTHHQWHICKCNAYRVIQIKSAASSIAGCVIWLVGYTTDAFVLFDNPITVTPAGSGAWTDVDVSASVPSGAVAAIITVAQAGTTSNVRPKGSTDNRVGSTTIGMYRMPVKLNNARIFEAYKGAAGDSILLYGYMVGGFVGYDNFTALATATTGAWTDVTALPGGATCGLYQMRRTGSYLNEKSGLRKNGASEDIWVTDKANFWAIVEPDAAGVVEQKINSAAQDLWLAGYFTSYAAASGGSGGGLQRFANQAPVSAILRR